MFLYLSYTYVLFLLQFIRPSTAPALTSSLRRPQGRPVVAATDRVNPPSQGPPLPHTYYGEIPFASEAEVTPHSRQLMDAAAESPALSQHQHIEAIKARAGKAVGTPLLVGEWNMAMGRIKRKAYDSLPRRLQLQYGHILIITT